MCFNESWNDFAFSGWATRSNSSFLLTFTMGGPRLPLPLLTTAGLCTLVAVLVSTISILLQLRNYRKPFLQRYSPSHSDIGPPFLRCFYRMVVRIMVMVPLYAIASWISLFSVEAAFFIDAIRDVYEVRPTPLHTPLNF